MLITYLFVMGIVLVVFVIGGLIVLKGQGRNGVTLGKDVATEPVAPSDVSPAGKAPVPQEELQDIKQALVDKLDQKCIKLEQILEEKNRILAQLQKDLESERAHRGEFESLRAILQQQIDDFKAQNRNLKEELERSLQENLRLQTGMMMPSGGEARSERPADTAIAAQEPRKSQPRGPDYVRAEPDDEIIPANPKPPSAQETPRESPDQEGPEDSLTLKDIFGEENKNKGTEQKS